MKEKERLVEKKVAEHGKIEVGILNFHYSNFNYGAVLQAAALEHYISSKGLSVEHIDFIPKYKKTIKQLLKNTKDKLIKAIKGIRTIENRNGINPEVFENFRNQWLTRTENTYKTLKDLEKEKFNYNFYVVGSDQVWRPLYTGNMIDAYFLHFAPNDSKKIAYAASFGEDTWEKVDDLELTEHVRSLINQFNSVSVREKSGITLCRKNFGINAIHVLDPVLLVGRSFFDAIIKERDTTDQDSVIVYYSITMNQNFQETIENLHNIINIPTENIYRKSSNENGKLRYSYNNVSDWLAKIRDSAFVVTDSFHCICFSILFEKQFIYCSNPNKMGGTRFESLLNGLGLEHRISQDSNSDKIKNLLKNEIDYTIVLSKLNAMREQSKSFLDSALSL